MPDFGITRRSLAMAAGAALEAIGLPAVAEAGISASDPDGALFELIRQHAEARATTERASTVFHAASAQAETLAPPRPDALLWRSGDFPGTGFGVALSERDLDGSPREYGARAVAHLRKREPFPSWTRRVGASISEGEAEACEARRLEIIGAWDRWQGARQAVDLATGRTAAGEACDAAADLVLDLAGEIARSRPRTLAGLRAFGVWIGRQIEADEMLDGHPASFARAVAGFGGDDP